MSIFKDDTQFWRFASIVFASIAILKGIRFPNSWTSTLAQIDYRYGFVKRGLLGTVYAALGVRHRIPLTVISIMEFIAFLSLFALLTHKSGIEKRFGSLAVVAMFTSSFSFTFLANLLGYTDIILASLLMSLLLIRSPHSRFLIGCPVTVIALLIHEGFLLLFFPVLLLSFVVDAACEVDLKLRRGMLNQLLILSLIALGTTLVVVFGGRISSSQVDLFHNEIIAHADFEPRNEFFDVLKVSALENLRQASHRLLTLRWFGAALLAVCVLGPVFVCLCHFCRRLILHSGLYLGKGWIYAVGATTCIAIAAPESMNLLGVDSMRWHVLTTLVGYFSLITLSMRLPGEDCQLSKVGFHVVILIIGLNLASGYGLYDSTQIRPYPFFPYLFLR